MGKGEFFDFHSAEEIWDEIRAVWKAGSGIESAGLQWPCPSEDHRGTKLLHTETFPAGKRAALRRVNFKPTEETTTEEFPFLLTTGRTLHQFNAGTMTLRTKNVVLHPADYLDIAPADAAALGLRDGERARLRSRHGEAVLWVRINPSVKAGELFATFHLAEVFLNYLTGPHRDTYAQTPEYKVTAVRVERA
jgi:formate dehydrogenase major subunit